MIKNSHFKWEIQLQLKIGVQSLSNNVSCSAAYCNMMYVIDGYQICSQT